MPLTRLCSALALLLWAATTSAQTEDWQRVEAHSEQKLNDIYMQTAVSPEWVKGADYIVFDQKENGITRYYITNPATGKTELLVDDMADVEQQYRKLTGDTKLRAGELRLYAVEMEAGNPHSFIFMKSGKRFAYDRKLHKLSVAPPKKEWKKERRGFFSTARTTTTDSLYTMLGDRYNLHLRDNRTGKTVQLTTDGAEDKSYCYATKSDDLSDRHAAGRWIGHVYVQTLIDDSAVGNLYLIDALAKPRPKLITKHMPLPNEKGVRRFGLYLYNSDTGKGGRVAIDKFKDQHVEFNIPDGGNALFFTRRSRTVDTLELCKVELATGKVITLIQEVVKPHLNLTLQNYRLIDGGKEILWWSERTGYGAYYRYSAEGKLLNRVTQGNTLVAGNIVRIDRKTNTMVFAGYGNIPDTDPCYTNYYKVGLNGKGQVRLTDGDYTHELKLSPSGRYAIDVRQRIDKAPNYVAIDLNNPRRYPETFVTRNIAPLEQAGWKAPLRVTVTAADGKTPLYGVMYLPSNLDPEKKYPVISNVYPGPQDDQIPRTFTIDDVGNQSLAELGFIVVNVAPRGSSPLRGRDFYCFSYGNLRDYPLADDKHTLETLAKEHPYMDLDRVGIYGHSGGGFMALAAMLTYPDFYKVCVSASGNHDNNIYIQWWGETFHGLGGTIPGNMELASRLKGSLLLISGDMDDNVPYASTLRMAKALIDQGKRFDMMILPGADHGVWSPYYQNLVRYYFKEHLVNPVKRDINIITHQ